MIEDDVDGIELFRISAVMSEDARGEWALEGCEAEHSLTIAPQHELVQAAAQSADAVVEDDWVKHVHNIDFSIQRSQQPRPFDQGSGQALRPRLRAGPSTRLRAGPSTRLRQALSLQRYGGTRTGRPRSICRAHTAGRRTNDEFSQIGLTTKEPPDKNGTIVFWLYLIPAPS